MKPEQSQMYEACHPVRARGVKIRDRRLSAGGPGSAALRALSGMTHVHADKVFAAALPVKREMTFEGAAFHRARIAA
jgi:hypothetical protein